jgi:phenylalanyl-tRNA synthetase alpha chain
MSNSEGISQAEVNKAIETALAEITKASSIAELKKVKGSILGEGSALAGFSAKLGKLAADQKAEAGKIVGYARAKVTEAFEARESELSAAEEAKLLEKEAIDITALGRIARTGARHPLSLLQEKISDVFVGMGWEIAEGPEVESEWFNFDALNFDADHPARAMQDTSRSWFLEPTLPLFR